MVFPASHSNGSWYRLHTLLSQSVSQTDRQTDSGTMSVHTIKLTDRSLNDCTASNHWTHFLWSKPFRCSMWKHHSIISSIVAEGEQSKLWETVWNMYYWSTDEYKTKRKERWTLSFDVSFSLNTAFKNLGTDLCYGLRFITNDDPVANTIEADKQL